MRVAAHMMAGASEEHIRRRALQEDVGQSSTLALVVCASVTCLLAIALALPTLDNIRRQPGFRSGRAVKISRRRVKATVVACRLCGRSNSLLRAGFAWLARPLPRVDADTAELWQRVSRWESPLS